MGCTYEVHYSAEADMLARRVRIFWDGQLASESVVLAPVWSG